MLPQASQTANMQGRFKPERANLSYADRHQEITGGKEVSPGSSWKHKKRHANIKANGEEELVKYMSNLPSYLERGAKKPQEKVLNVGVLEWRRLEKWQGSHKQISHSSISSLSDSNTSSTLSTDESSAHSSTGHSRSPACQRLQRPSLQSHLMSVPIKGHLPLVKPLRESTGKFPDPKTTKRSTFTVQEKFIREDISFCKNNPQIKLEQFERREMLPKNGSESGTVSNGVKDNATSCDKVKINNQRSEFMKKADMFQEVVPIGANQDVTEKRNTVILLLPRDMPKAKTNHSGSANLSDLTTKSCKKETEPRPRTFTETFKEAHHAELSSSFYHSGPLPCELDGSKHLEIKAMGHVDINSDGFTSERSRSVPRAAKIEISSSKSRNLEEEKLNSTNVASAANEACKRLDPKVHKVASEKVRSTSPFLRLSFSRGKTVKSSGLKEGSSVPQMSSTSSSAKTKPDNPVASGVDTCGNKLSAKSRASSSPLRRLLDPLLKPKAVNCRSITNQLQESIITEGACKSSERTRHSTVTVQPAKAKSDTTNHCIINVNDSAPNKKNGSSAAQALLRVQVKNELPLLTFAVDNDCNILAATVKLLSSSGKGDYECIYTFFAIKEVRKKKGMWINQGRKGKGQDYAPKAVAQMKVSHLSRSNHVDQFSIREFILLTSDVGQENPQASDFQPNDEQAAIIVKIPKRNSRNSIRGGYLIDKRNSLPEATQKECLPEVKLELNSAKKASFVGVQDISATVILPSGVHSLPNKGEPSSLIQRWKSGGACDCGGWDLACELRILSNKSQCNQQPSSLKGSSTFNQFELFSQGVGEDNKLFFSLSPFNDGIYSVEFNSSLSLMQAFAISIAVWDSGKHTELSEPVASFEERTLGNDRTSVTNPIAGEAPARYVSYPPLSPVGRA